MNDYSRAQCKDISLLIKFTQVYCRAKHHGPTVAMELPGTLQASCRNEVSLCADCKEFLSYALRKRTLCPLNPKPSCKHCPIHCYSHEYRTKAREIMAFSGRRMILRGRLDYLWHYLF
jgi:hypothetical protein